MNKPETATQEDDWTLNPRGGVILSINTASFLHARDRKILSRDL